MRLRSITTSKRHASIAEAEADAPAHDVIVAGIDLPRAREGASTITIGFLNIFKKTSRTRSKLHESYSKLL